MICTANDVNVGDYVYFHSIEKSVPYEVMSIDKEKAIFSLKDYDGKIKDHNIFPFWRGEWCTLDKTKLNDKDVLDRIQLEREREERASKWEF